jgi:hypothetical protein
MSELLPSMTGRLFFPREHMKDVSMAQDLIRVVGGEHVMRGYDVLCHHRDTCCSCGFLVTSCVMI